AALTDSKQLQSCLPGCERLEPVGENVCEGVLKIGLSGLKGTYTGRMELSDLHAPESFVMTVEGKGGPGFVKGRATLRLDESAEGTLLHCEADVQVGGVLAAVGSRLIQAGAKKMMDDYFYCLEEKLHSLP